MIKTKKSIVVLKKIKVQKKTEKNQDGLLERVNAYIIETDAYTQADLTIVDIAKNIGVHPKRISDAINSQLDQNFNTYINNFRIKKAIAMLESDMANSLSIEGIAHEVGFHSRSSFILLLKRLQEPHLPFTKLISVFFQ